MVPIPTLPIAAAYVRGGDPAISLAILRIMALLLGQEKKIGSFPVVDNGKLIGITTESDIVRLVTAVLGMKEEGARITIKGLKMKLGNLSKIDDFGIRPDSEKIWDDLKNY